VNNKKYILIFLIVLFAVVSIAAAWFFFGNNSTSDNSSQKADSASQGSISLSQVAMNDGKNGKPCWVVVDNTVYEISGFAKWVDGMHTSSNGKASCGKDLSSVINESPHGKAKLRLLKEIGQLSQ
jgi:predicted heme/steroid binding protein